MSSSFEDAFHALRGGAIFSKSKHAADMDLFQESFPSSQAARHTATTQSLAKELDFFGSTLEPSHSSDKPESEGGKIKRSKLIGKGDETPDGRKGKEKSKADVSKDAGAQSGKKLSAKQALAQRLAESKKQAISVEAANLLRKAHRIKVSSGDAPAPLADFQDLDDRYECTPDLLSQLTSLGYLQPTPIQRQTIPILLQGSEAMCIAPTGSGKTLAFLLPILLKLQAPKKVGPRALLLSPTRELALQTARVFKRLMQGLGAKPLRLCVLSKANSGAINWQRVDVLLSTPLRLKGLVDTGGVALGEVLFLVLDEADKLFEMGFVEQIDSIVGGCSHPDIQRCLFSATLPESVEELGRSVMVAPLRVTVGERNTASSSVSQRLLFVGQAEEGRLLAVTQLLRSGELRPPALIFLHSKDRAQELYNELRYDGLRVGAIHAGMSATKRAAVVDQFRSGEVWFLIATDLMARGVDFVGVQSVLNFDFPESSISYIHRIGRTGRAGKQGHAVTLFTEEDAPKLKSIVNVMRASGCEVEEWMLKLKKGPKHSKKRQNGTKGNKSVG